MDATPRTNTIDPVTHMMAWEDGTLGLDDTIGLFQYLIDTRKIEALPAAYGRMALELMGCGLCRPRAKG